MNEGNVMGNMSTLEQKVDVLLRFCMAKTEAERSACYGDLRQVQSAASEQIQIYTCTERVLMELGISDKLKGFVYLQTAIAIILGEPDAAYAITTVVYPRVAKVHKTVPPAVERCIRHAIEWGWLRCDSYTQEKYFANQVDPLRGKPTNGQFLIRVAHVVRNSISCLQN